MAKRVKRETKAQREARGFLADVSEQYVFWCHDGRILRNMKELGDALSVMTDETFGYHSNTGKKDFSTWVRDIIGDEKMAQNLEEAASRTLAADLVATRVASLTRQPTQASASLSGSGPLVRPYDLK